MLNSKSVVLIKNFCIQKSIRTRFIFVHFSLVVSMQIKTYEFKNSNVVNYISLNTIGWNLMRLETFASVYRWAKITRGENNPLYSTCRYIIFILPCTHYSNSLIRFVYNYCLQYVKI